MPERVRPLSDRQLRNAKAKERAYRLFDGGGLYLEVTPNGAKLWWLKYRRRDGAARIGFGAYPTVGRAIARQRRDDTKVALAQRSDPREARQAAAGAARREAVNAFEAVARDWHATMLEQWQPQTAQNILHRFEADIFSFVS